MNVWRMNLLDNRDEPNRNIKARQTIECKSDAIKEETVKLFKDLRMKNN